MIPLNTFFLGLSDLLINLAAGWFGVAVIIPIVIRKAKVKFVPLIVNLFFAIVSFIIAIYLRSYYGH